jgi:hypothetical protein
MGYCLTMKHLLTFLSLAVLLQILRPSLFAADDPYAAWGHGRPQDAIAALHARAESEQRWDAWLDAGLAAAAANRQGEAIAWTLAAHQMAPERSEPRQALRALNVTLPVGWVDRLGPLILPGQGWLGILLLCLGAACLGYSLCTNRQRMGTFIIGCFLLLIALPGRIAIEHDQTRSLISAVRDTLLYDSAGKPMTAITIGSIFYRDQTDAWADRLLVVLNDGTRGFVPVVDTVAKP